MKYLAILLILIGIGLAIFSIQEYFIPEKVADVAGIKIFVDQPKKSITWMPVGAVIGLLLGGALLWHSSRKA